MCMLNAFAVLLQLFQGQGAQEVGLCDAVTQLQSSQAVLCCMLVQLKLQEANGPVDKAGACFLWVLLLMSERKSLRQQAGCKLEISFSGLLCSLLLVSPGLDDVTCCPLNTACDEISKSCYVIW